MSEPLLCTTRNEVVERLERGHCVVSTSDGTVVWAAGDPEHVTFLRSAAKPIQATALIRSGAVERFGLSESELAVACGSHHGEPRHVQTVLNMLRHADVPPEALGCGSHELGQPVALRLAQQGLAPTPLHNNCSGKHAGMLAAARALGAPLDSYLHTEHPVQKLIIEALSQCSGVAPSAIHRGIDGCSAPNFALPMRRIAQCFASIAAPDAVEPELGAALTRTATAMRADPWLVQGTAGFDSHLMAERTAHIVSKGGAEGLQCVALPARGLGIAVKFESGRAVGIGSVVLAILEALGVFGETVPDSLRAFDTPAVRNHRGIVVGATQVLVDTAPLARLALSAA